MPLKPAWKSRVSLKSANCLNCAEGEDDHLIHILAAALLKTVEKMSAMSENYFDQGHRFNLAQREIVCSFEDL